MEEYEEDSSPDLGTMSTAEIQQWRMKEVIRNRNTVKVKEEHQLCGIEKMTAKDVQEYVVFTSTSYDALLAKILRLKVLQRIDKGYYQILQIHGCLKFNEMKSLRQLMKECIHQHGSAFLNRIVKYAAQFCYYQTEILPIMQWSNLMTMRADYDWTKSFNNAILASPDKETQLYAAMIMLIPNPSQKNANRVFAAIAKQETLPPCFEFLAKRAFQFVSISAFHKSDMEPITRKYLASVYETCFKWKLQNKKNVEAGKKAQDMFTSKTLGIANKVFGMIRQSDDNAAESLLANPFHQINNPTELFIEYFLQYVKLGLFKFDKGDKIIAWNYYYDDRWCGYDRLDLFGERNTFTLTENFKWCEDFKYVGTIAQHPHHINLVLGSKVFEWMNTDPKVYDELMEKYESEDLIEYFMISASFAGRFQDMISIFERYKSKMKTIHGYLCLHLCYMYGCAKEGMAKEALMSWVHIMETAVKNHLLGVLKFAPNTFPLPPFVSIRYVGQFACRMLRNCLFFTCVRDGTESWKKYGLIILHLCDALEDSFLNHNMMLILFQKISLEDMHHVIKPAMTTCIRHHRTFWNCLQIARSRGYDIPASCYKDKLLPTPENDHNVHPGFLVVYNKLKKLDEIFYEVMDDLPKIVFRDIEVEKLDCISHLPVEKQEMVKTIVEYHQKRKRILENRKLRAERKEKRRLKKQLRKYATEDDRRVKRRKPKKKDTNQKEKDSSDSRPLSSVPVSEVVSADESGVEEMEIPSENGNFDAAEPSSEPIYQNGSNGCTASEQDVENRNHDEEVATGPGETDSPIPISPAEIKQELAEIEGFPQDVEVKEENIDEGNQVTGEAPALEAEEPTAKVEEQMETNDDKPLVLNTPVLDVEKAPQDPEDHVLEHKEGEDDSLPVEAHFVEAPDIVKEEPIPEEASESPNVPEEKPMETD